MLHSQCSFIGVVYSKSDGRLRIKFHNTSNNAHSMEWLRRFFCTTNNQKLFIFSICRCRMQHENLFCIFMYRNCVLVVDVSFDSSTIGKMVRMENRSCQTCDVSCHFGFFFSGTTHIIRANWNFQIKTNSFMHWCVFLFYVIYATGFMRYSNKICLWIYWWGAAYGSDASQQFKYAFNKLIFRLEKYIKILLVKKKFDHNNFYSLRITIYENNIYRNYHDKKLSIKKLN